MMLTNERSPPPLEQDARMVQGGAASLTALERRLAPSCERVEPRQRVRADLRGLLSPAERTNSWPWAKSCAVMWGRRWRTPRPCWSSTPPAF